MPYLKTKPVVIETVIAIAGQPYRTPNGFKEYPAGTVLRLEEIQEADHLPKVGFMYPLDAEDVEEFFEPATEDEFAAFINQQTPAEVTEATSITVSEEDAA